MSAKESNKLRFGAAGIAGAVTLVTCSPNTIRFRVSNCGQGRQVFLNVLVDWNHDGDWNDIVRCTPTECTPEWCLKNVPIDIPAGCNELVSPAFAGGNTAGKVLFAPTSGQATVTRVGAT